MQVYELNESFKALVREALPQKEQNEALLKVFDEIVNDRATKQRIGLEDLKSRALDDIKSEFATKDFVRAEIENVRAEIVKSKIEIIKWVLGIQLSIGALIVAILKFL